MKTEHTKIKHISKYQQNIFKENSISMIVKYHCFQQQIVFQVYIRLQTTKIKWKPLKLHKCNCNADTSTILIIFLYLKICLLIHKYFGMLLLLFLRKNYKRKSFFSDFCPPNQSHVIWTTYIYIYKNIKIIWAVIAQYDYCMLTIYIYFISPKEL